MVLLINTVALSMDEDIPKNSSFSFMKVWWVDFFLALQGFIINMLLMKNIRFLLGLILLALVSCGEQHQDT